jgi:extradiol dioxygenase family protein
MRARLDHVVLNAKDVERLLAFYSDVIGLSPERVSEYRQGTVLFPSLRLGPDSVIDVLPPTLWAAAGPSAQSHPNVDHFCIALDAADWPPLLERLERSGVALELPPTQLWGARGQGIAIYIRDPEGNRVELRHYPG